MDAIDTDVLIVGAGPVGLALAIELASRGIDCHVVERNDRIGLAPRAKTTNVRTRAHLRCWGIADALAEASPFGVDYPSDIAFVTRLNGKLLCRITNASNCAPARNPLYPEHGQWIPQYKLEQVLRLHLDTLPAAHLHLSVRLYAARQHDDRVDAVIRDLASGEDRPVSCRYLVGADGAGSAVRKLLGIRMEGTYGISRNYNIVFRAPGLAARHPHGKATMYWHVNPDAPGLLGPMDEGDVWFFMPTKLPRGEALTDAEAVKLIRRTTGIDLPYEILSSDEWMASRLIADRYGDGRIMLAGDACHQHPPFGGFGMNMGISDAVDLGWKISATLQGWGGEALLPSYEAERRPVHEAVMAEAMANHTVLANDLLRAELDSDTPEGERARAEIASVILAAKTSEFHTLGTVLGACYGASPIVLANGVPAGQQRGARYVPSSSPGCLAPHLWLPGGKSLYDLFGNGFALVAGPGVAMASVDQAVSDAIKSHVPLAIIDLTDEPAATEHYRDSLTLIRPDQHIAWRGASWRSEVLARATGWAPPAAIAN